MPKFNKKIIIAFSIVFLFIVLANFALAADPVNFVPEIGLGDDFAAHSVNTVNGSTLGKVLISVYKYVIGLLGIAATVVMMIGGLRWMASGGDGKAINSAKHMIETSLIGLALGLCSYLILATVNTDLTKTYNLDIKKIEDTSSPIDFGDKTSTTVPGEDNSIGCCLVIRGEGRISTNNTKSGCDKAGGSFFAGTTANNDNCSSDESLCANQANGTIFAKRSINGYCKDNKWEVLKKNGETCKENFECSSKNCKSTTTYGDYGETFFEYNCE